MFRPEAGMVDVDLWVFQHHLREAAQAPNDEVAIAALTAATDLYRGDLLDGLYHEWAAPAREHLRQQAIGALVRLADLAEGDNHLDAALSALDRAITIDPYGETVYQRAMRIHIQLGQADAARRLYRQLAIRLLEIEAEPADETEAMLTAIHPTTRAQRAS